MSLNKAIEHGKEHRKQYTDIRLIDVTCRNHGSCPYCRKNRMFKFDVRRQPQSYIEEEDNESN